MKKNRWFYQFVKAVLKPFVKLFFPYEVKGVENLKNIGGGHILCSNHLSNMDPVFLIVIHPKQIYFMGKAELFRNKLSKWFFSNMGAFAVERGKNDKTAINTALELLKTQNILGLFIEGTRSKTGEFLRPKSGAAVLAYNTNSPVLPICITGSGENNKVKMFKKTTISIGAPILINDLNIQTETRLEFKHATNLIMDSIKRLRT